jgi:glycosyltransferase involved in cell wall biosynthesis
MISVVIPLYNKEQSIVSTLQTVLNQTYQDFEIIIVDDGSTDHSADEVSKLTDSRIRLIHQNNAGVSAARNRGITEAQGKYIAFLDADDEWKPDYLKAQYKLTQKYPECSVFACNYEFKDTQGKVTPTVIRKLPFKGENGILSNYFEVASCSNPPLWTSAVMVKKVAVQSVDGFPVDIKSGEDLLTWVKLAVNEKIAFSKQTLAVYHIRNEASRSLSDLRKTAPKDLRSTNDKVGLELQCIYKSCHDRIQQKRLSLYIAFWYKMRASINLKLEYRYAAIRCASKSLSYNYRSIKPYIIILIALSCPRLIIKKIIK